MIETTEPPSFGAPDALPRAPLLSHLSHQTSRSTRQGTNSEPCASISMLRPNESRLKTTAEPPTYPKRRPILMAPLHTARQDSRDPSSSFPFQIRRGQIRNRGLLRTPEPPSISPGSREPPEGQRKNKQRGREEASGSGRRLRPPGTHQSRVLFFLVERVFETFFLIMIWHKLDLLCFVVRVVYLAAKDV